MTTPSPISDQAAGELRVLPKDVLDALRFYAHGDHYSIDDDHQQFDTVSGEPVNWMFSEKDDDCTMFEDGGIARAVLAGRSAGFEEPVEPFKGEVFTARSTAPTTGSAPVATLHDDGYYTFHGEKPQGFNYQGWRMDVYAAPASLAANVIGPDQRQAIRVAIDLAESNGYPETCQTLRALLAASMGGDRT